MFSWIYGNYFYVSDLIKIIDEIESKRQIKRIQGLTMNTTFCQDLKDEIMGIKEIKKPEEV
tara:strand:+ start:5055 stop:5237 length:183 start_codon:yes stop_codon:yes gene_type:complete